MKNKFKLQLLAAAMISAIGMTAHADDAKRTSSGKSSAVVTKSSDAQLQGRDVRASKLIGTDVKNAKGEDMGEIHDLMLDPVSQRVSYAVLSFGGVMGLGEKLFAFPVNAFKASADKDELVLNVDKERLKDAPGFEKNNWPDMNSGKYRSEVDRYHKSESAAAGKSGGRLMRASELIGKDVNDQAGKDAGEIEDVVVNMTNGQIRYVVLDFDKKWSPDDKLVALPMKALTFPRDKDGDLVLNIARDKIDMARGFDEDKWPDLNSAEFRRDQDNYLSSVDTGRNIEPGRDKGDRPITYGASGARSSSESSK
jgi:sporulation protein YlmC with PRC-barrel domain